MTRPHVIRVTSPVVKAISLTHRADGIYAHGFTSETAAHDLSAHRSES